MLIIKKILFYLDIFFKISLRKSTFKKEIIAGLTTFLSMVYSVIVIPNMLQKSGFPSHAIFVSTCLVASFGSIIMGIWANLPIAIGCTISLAAFTSFNLILEQKLNISTALGAIFLMGIFFTMISITGIRKWILLNLPNGIAQGTGIGIGLFLLLIASNNIGLIIKNVQPGLPITLGNFSSLPVILSLSGLAMLCGLEKRNIPGSIFFTIIIISVIGIIIDPEIKYKGFFSFPISLKEKNNILLFHLNIKQALDPSILSGILALIITAVFDATATIKAVTNQANINNISDKNSNVINTDKAILADSISSIFASIIGATPAGVYIESAAGISSGGKTGLTAVIVGIMFFFILFIGPIAYLVPSYATAPALMYVGLLMLSNVSKIDFSDFIDATSGLIVAVFIVLSCNIVTGIMLGFMVLIISRIFSGEFKKLKFGTIFIAIILFIFYFISS